LRLARFPNNKLTLFQFVQCLASPRYLNHLAVQKYFENPAFVAYLNYLQYWSHPPYTKFLNYPGPTLKNLELLQQERFRKDIMDGNFVATLEQEVYEKGLKGPGS
jgi:mediator of RNA polymerase II transcription subunit 31